MNSNFIWRYQVVPENSYHPDIGAYRTYGIQAITSESISIHDVATDRELVERMAKMFTQYHLDPIHLFDAVEDMLP